MGIGWSVFSCVIPYLRPLITAYETDGLSSKNGSKRTSLPSSQGSKKELRLPQRQASLNLADGVRIEEQDLGPLEKKVETRNQDGTAGASRHGEKDSGGGIKKTVKVEWNDGAPTQENSIASGENTEPVVIGG